MRPSFFVFLIVIIPAGALGSLHVGDALRTPGPLHCGLPQPGPADPKNPLVPDASMGFVILLLVACA